MSWRSALAIGVVVIAINFATMPREEYPGDAAMVRWDCIAFLNTGHWAMPPAIAVECGIIARFLGARYQGGERLVSGGIEDVGFIGLDTHERHRFGRVAIKVQVGNAVHRNARRLPEIVSTAARNLSVESQLLNDER